MNYSPFLHGTTAPSRPGPTHCQSFTITVIYTTQWIFCGMTISPLRILLPGNTQHSKETNIHAPAGLEHKISAKLLNKQYNYTVINIFMFNWRIPSHDWEEKVKEYKEYISETFHFWNHTFILLLNHIFFRNEHIHLVTFYIIIIIIIITLEYV